MPGLGDTELVNEKSETVGATKAGIETSYEFRVISVSLPSPPQLVLKARSWATNQSV
jgi:hypothetical protein